MKSAMEVAQFNFAIRNHMSLFEIDAKHCYIRG